MMVDEKGQAVKNEFDGVVEDTVGAGCMDYGLWAMGHGLL